MGFPSSTQIHFHATLFGYYGKLWVICKEFKNTGRSKHLKETTGNIKIQHDSGTAVNKPLYQHDLEAHFPDFDFLLFPFLIHSSSNFAVALVPNFIHYLYCYSLFVHIVKRGSVIGITLYFANVVRNRFIKNIQD